MREYQVKLNGETYAFSSPEKRKAFISEVAPQAVPSGLDTGLLTTLNTQTAGAAVPALAGINAVVEQLGGQMSPEGTPTIPDDLGASFQMNKERLDKVLTADNPGAKLVGSMAGIALSPGGGLAGAANKIATKLAGPMGNVAQAALAGGGSGIQAYAGGTPTEDISALGTTGAGVGGAGVGFTLGGLKEGLSAATQRLGREAGNKIAERAPVFDDSGKMVGNVGFGDWVAQNFGRVSDDIDLKNKMTDYIKLNAAQAEDALQQSGAQIQLPKEVSSQLLVKIAKKMEDAGEVSNSSFLKDIATRMGFGMNVAGNKTVSASEAGKLKMLLNDIAYNSKGNPQDTLLGQNASTASATLRKSILSSLPEEAKNFYLTAEQNLSKAIPFSRDYETFMAGKKAIAPSVMSIVSKLLPQYLQSPKMFSKMGEVRPESRSTVVSFLSKYFPSLMQTVSSTVDLSGKPSFKTGE